MAKKKPYTDEQVQILSQNPYTHSVTPNRLVFTVAFKEFFIKQTKISGMTTKKILLAAGYNPDFFEKGALDAIRYTIIKEANSPEGFRSPRGLSDTEKNALFASKDLSKQNTDVSMKELQNRIVHLEQQIAFLKKISHVRRQNRKDDIP